MSDSPDNSPKSTSAIRKNAKSKTPPIKTRKKTHAANKEDRKWYHPTAGQGANIISFIMMMGTIFLAYKANNSSNRSVELADSVFKATKRYNDSNLAIQDKLFHNNEIESKKRFNNDSISLNAQIQNLQEVQKQFAIINTPVLEISDVTLGSITDGSVNIGYKIRSLNSSIVTIVKHTDTIIIQDKPDLEIENNFSLSELKMKPSLNQAFYISNEKKEMAISFHYQGYMPILFDKYKSGNIHIYLLGRVYYSSEMSKKMREYEYIFKFIGNIITNKSAYVFIYSKNRYTDTLSR